MAGERENAVRNASDEAGARDDLLRAVIDNAPFGAHMYRLDDDERLVFIGYNLKAEEMLGIGHAQLLGLTLEEAFPGNVGTETPAAYRRVAREGGVYDLDEYAYDAEGISGAFEVHAFWFGPRRVSVFFRDVTEKRKDEARLRDANEKLAMAESAARAGFWSWDMRTGTLTWSPPFYELFGLPADAEASFDTWRATIHPDDLEAAERHIAEAAERHTPLDNEYRIVLPGGSVRWIAATGTIAYDDDGAPLHMSGICIDIDDRKHREEEVRALNEELEQRVEVRTRELTLANRELQDFVYSVSHDLRSPLRALDGFSEVLLEDYAASLDADANDCLRRIRAAAQRMAKLIDALLALSRVGRRDVLLSEVDVSAATRGVLARLAQQEPERRVSVTVADGLVARTDAALADIVLENLLGNAWKFTTKRDAASIEVARERSDGVPVFFVRDNGVGFDEARGDDVFRPFSRLHGEDDYPGTGIGLATVRRAMDRLGGRCWAQSAPDEGATFFFTLGPS